MSDDMGTCEKCKKAPAVSMTVCRVVIDGRRETCNATYRRCEACGGDKAAERSVRAHQALMHPLPKLMPWRRRRPRADAPGGRK